MRRLFELTALIVLAARPVLAEDELVREVYVPYDELLRIASKDPSGIVMSFEEYQELVARALANRPAKKVDTDPPPLASTAVASSVSGFFAEGALHLRADIDIAVAADDWVRCDLGPAPPHVGAVLVDGKPGWALVVPDRRPVKRKLPPRLELILKGRGAHEATIEFSIPAREVEDRWLVEGDVPSGAATSLAIEVPGDVAGESTPSFLRRATRTESDVPRGDGEGVATLFEVGLGSSGRFELSWRRQYDGGRQPAVYSARHFLTYRADPRDPAFTWYAAVEILRKKATRIELVPPAGARVLRVEGDHVHSFEAVTTPDGERLRVLLHGPMLGTVRLRATGVLAAPESLPPTPDGRARSRFELGLPDVVNAIRNRGEIGVQVAAGAKLGTIELDAIRSIAAGDIAEPLVPADHAAGLDRLFAFQDASGRARVEVESLESALEVSSTTRIRVDERTERVHAAYRLSARDGRIFALALRVPAGLVLENLVPADGRDRDRIGAPLLAGVADPGGQFSTVHIDLSRAIEPSSPLVVHAIFARPMTDDGVGVARAVDLPLPTFAAASRRRLAVGVELDGALDATMGALPGWRAIPSASVGSYAFDAGLLVAAVERELGAGELPGSIALDVRPQDTRGVYEAVSDIVATETAFRVRADVRLSVFGRPIDAILVALPIPAEKAALVVGPEIREWTPRSTQQGPRRLLRFQRSWRGERVLRFEFDMPPNPGQATAIPFVEIVPASPDGEAIADGGFDGLRFVALASVGGVRLTADPGSALTSVELDDFPEFFEARPGGSGARAVAQFRVNERALVAARAQNTFPTMTSTPLERTPILERGIPELTLVTTIHRSGVSRTEASCVLRYQGDQRVRIDLDPGTRVLSVEVDGEPVRPIAGGGDAAAGSVLVALPARSYAAIRLVYERAGSALGMRGVWTERGPIFRIGDDVPVVRSRWSIFEPAGLRVELRGETIDSLSGRVPLTFASTFWGRLLSLQWPRWITWEDPALPVAVAAAPQVAVARASSSGARAETPPQSVALLQSVQTEHAGESRALPSFNLRHEGVPTVVTKLGGRPEVRLAYHDPGFERFTRRGVFALALLFGAVLLRRGRRDLFAMYLAFGLFILTFLPAVFAWESTLLLIPFAEGCAALAFALAGWWCVRRVPRIFRSVLRSVSRVARKVLFRARRWRQPVATALVALVALVGATDRACAQNARPAIPPAGKAAASDDPVLIPYSIDDFLRGKTTLPAAPEKRKVYVPYRKFAELWALAHSERVEPPDDASRPADVVIGNVRYELAVDGTRYRATGRIPVRIYKRGWVSVPLAFGGVQLARIALDGQPDPIGVSYDKNGVPFVTILGPSAHDLHVELEGTVARGLGEATVAADLVTGVATRVEATLPDGVRVERVGSASGAPLRDLTDGNDGASDRVRIDLGSEGRLHLRWRAPTIVSDRTPVVTAVSASGFDLDLDGYRVTRLQRVRVEGQPVSHLRFLLRGRWEISSVAGKDVSDWLVSAVENAGAPDGVQLEVFLSKSASAVELDIRGFAPCGTDPVPPAGLALAGATREEGLIALNHHTLRRFPLDVLSGLERRSRRDAVAFFATHGFARGGASSAFVGDGASYDRIFHAHGDTSAERVRATDAPATGGVQTELAALVAPDRVAVAARVAFDTITGPGPLEYRVAMPDGWEPRSVTGPTVRDDDVRVIGGVRMLVVSLAARATTGTTIDWYAEREGVNVGEGDGGAVAQASVELPSFTPALDTGTFRQATSWFVAASDGLALREDPRTNLSPRPLESARKWLELDPHMSYRLAYRSLQSDSTLVVVASPSRTKIRAAMSTLARISEQHVDVKAAIRFDVSGRGTRTLRLRLPADAERVTISLANRLTRTDSRTPDGLEIALTLPSPTMGSIPLELGFRRPRAAGEDVAIRGAEVLDVEHLSETVAIVRNPLRGFRITNVTGLQALQDEEIAASMRTHESQIGTLLALAGGLEVERAFLAIDRPWALDLLEEDAQPLEGFDALLEFAEAKTVLAADGTNWTNVVYTIYNRSRQFIEVRMPADAVIWRVLVNGNPVRVNTRGESLLIPVERMTDTDLSLEVSLTYTLPALELPAAWQSFAPEAPHVVLSRGQSFETLWQVRVPERYDISDVDGNLREVISNVRHGERVRNFIAQIDRIEKRLELPKTEAELTRRERSRAEANLSQLQQSLADAVNDLETAGEITTWEQSNISKDAVRQQVLQNDFFAQQGQQRYVELQKRQDEQKKTGAAGEKPRVDQAYDDACRFMNTALDGVAQAQAREQSRTRQPGKRNEQLDAYRRALGIIAAPPAAQSASLAPSQPGAGGRAPTKQRALGSLERGERGLEIADDGVDITLPEHGQIFTFRGKVSEPKLELDLRAKEVPGRLWHALGLVVALLGLWGLWLVRD